MKNPLMALVAAVLVAAVGIFAVQPAKADGAATTRAIILGAAAVAAGIAINANIAHKRQVANTIVGYLQDGSAVYQDGRVVTPNGQSYYPSQYGQTVACSYQTCYLQGGSGNPYYGYNGNQYYGNQGYNGNPNYNYNNGQPAFGINGTPNYNYAANTNGNRSCKNANYKNGYYRNGAGSYQNGNYNNGNYNPNYQYTYYARQRRVANDEHDR